MTRSLTVATLACTLSAFAASAQEAPRISVTEAHLLTTFNAPGIDEPYWVLTLQHFSTWRYGSNFFFVDLVDSPDLNFFMGEPGLYLEYAPVLSLGRLGLLPLPAGGVLRDAGVTAQINAGWTVGSETGAFPINRVFLGGVELAWGLPGFAVLNTQLLTRQERSYDRGWQVTGVYTLPVPLGRATGVVTGFVDLWSRSGGPEGESYTVLLAQPQLLVGIRPNLQIGVELEPSRNFPNTFVSEGWNLAFSPMVRWVF
jgi:hypothetical protein